MISREDIFEVRARDFLENIDHYEDYPNILTELVYQKTPKDTTFLSIIIPIYDHPIELVKRAVDSVLFQKCDFGLELIIIDDYVKSNRNDVILEYVKKIENCNVLYYKNSDNLGVFANWNRGIQLAHSDWVTILHTDDFLKNNFLSNMKKIIDTHPEIDQLCCKYKMIKIKENAVDYNLEFLSAETQCMVRKVKYTEYFYEMKTSVKGALYRKEKLLELGGFRNQGKGIGLDDYPLMLRFAYYYNTYLIDSVMYVDSWGYNDSLNIKHWYPELVENYYMWLYFAGKERGIKRKIYEANAKYLLRKRAIAYDNGTSWVGVPVPIDMEQLQLDCEVSFAGCNAFEEKLVSFGARVINYLYKHPLKGFTVTLSKGISISELI